MTTEVVDSVCLVAESSEGILVVVEKVNVEIIVGSATPNPAHDKIITEVVTLHPQGHLSFMFFPDISTSLVTKLKHPLRLGGGSVNGPVNGWTLLRWTALPKKEFTLALKGHTDITGVNIPETAESATVLPSYVRKRLRIEILWHNK
jgi:hypothetical protein